LQHFRQRIRSGLVEKVSVQGGGGGGPAGARVGVSLSSGSAGVSGWVGEVGDVGGESGGAAGRLENQPVRATASRLGIQPVRVMAPALRAASAMAADLSVEPGGPEKQAITAVPFRSRFLATARPSICA
jgi:hypothetical protein